MTKFKRRLKTLFQVVLGLFIVGLLMRFMSPSGFLFVAIVFAIIGGTVWLLFRGLFLIFGRLGFTKSIHKKAIVVSTILLFAAFSWAPWGQYMVLSAETISQKDTINVAPIYWRFFGWPGLGADFVEEVLNRRFGDRKEAQPLINYLQKSEFTCRPFRVREPTKTTGIVEYTQGTSCERFHMGVLFLNRWHVSIRHEDDVISGIFVSQYLEAI